jgi:predicted PolB exonuclease-like 3'-5' exonuclease
MPSEEVLSEKWEKMASLYAEFAKICAISITYLKDGVLKCKAYYGEDEKDILTNFGKDLNSFHKFNSNYRLLGHAAKYYDYPVLCKRYIINGLDIPSILDESGAKPWEMRNMDTNDLWKSFGTGPGSSLQALCTVLDIPISKVDLVGDEVGEAYFRGELERISNYCSLDTIATYNVFRKLKKEPIFSFDEVIYIK